MTMFKAMPKSATKAAIIGVLVVLLAACSTLRLAYGNGPQLAWWWIDGYIDFSSQQTPRAKAAIDQWFAWHRKTQLADYVTVLAEAEQLVMEPATPALACRWQHRLRESADPALQHAIETFADLVPGLGEAQLKHLEQRFAKNDDKMRKDYLQPDAEDRADAGVKRTLEYAEMLYGRLGDAQRKVIAAGIAASPFDADAWVAERRKRQHDTVNTLRRLVAEHADYDHTVAALRVLAANAEHSPDPVYRAYQAKLIDYNCAFAAQIHNATTPAQRQAARERLATWQADLRSFANPG